MTETNHSGTTFWEHSLPKCGFNSEHCPGKTRGIERPGIFQGLVGLDPPCRSYTNDPSTINIPRGFLVSNIIWRGKNVMDLLLELMVALSEALFENYQTKKRGKFFGSKIGASLKFFQC